MYNTQRRVGASGATKVVQDISKLVNNPDGSDVHFLVGGDDIEKDGDIANQKRNRTEPVTMYGHTLILRYRSKYFHTLLNNDCKDKPSGIIRMPNISHVAFHALLYYIYTGSVQVNDETLLLELIAAAEEMELDELSAECQANVMDVLNQVVSEEYDDDDKTKYRKPERIPFNLAVRTFLIPGLILAHQHALSEFFQNLLDFTIVHMETIYMSTVTRATFLGEIPLKLFLQILTSDSLPLVEFDVWQLALDWACHKVKLLKSMVESQLKLNVASRHDEQSLISAEQLKALSSVFMPLTPAIRFTLFDPKQYASTAKVIKYFLPERADELERFFSRSNNKLVETPRSGSQHTLGSGIADDESFKLLKQWIIDAKGMTGCNLSNNLRFKKLYQASIDGFQASTFHQRCDNQGPTLVLVKSSTGHRFGGANFNSWASNDDYTSSNTNFLFALKDGLHRQSPVIFKISNASYGSYNAANCGPTFGKGYDMHISDMPNSSTKSYSNLSNSYSGSDASVTSLAGAKNFFVTDYEVFHISKK